MFTAQQLFEILANKEDASQRADGQPSNRAATLLYALWEGYRDERPDNQSERDFANALDRMMDTSESSAGFLKGVPNAENIFASTFGRFVDDFRRAYDALPKEIKEQEKINQIALEVEALSARKAKEAEEAAAKIKEEVQEEIKEEAPEETVVIEEEPTEEKVEKEQFEAEKDASAVKEDNREKIKDKYEAKTVVIEEESVEEEADQEQPETEKDAAEIKEEGKEEIKEEAPKETGVIEEGPTEEVEKEQPETNEAASAVKEDNREKIKEKYKATMDVIEEAPEEEVDQEQPETEKDAPIIKEEVKEEVNNEVEGEIEEEAEEVDKEQSETNEAASAVKETGSQAQNISELDDHKLDEPEQSVKTLKDKFEEEMRKQTELFYTEYDRYHLYKEKESTARKDNNAEEISKNASEREKAEKRLKDDLATIVVMDNLRQREKWAAALDRSELNKQKEKLRENHQSFGTIWKFIGLMKEGMSSLIVKLRPFTSTDLGERLIKAEETVTKRRERAAEGKEAQAVSQTQVQKPEAKEAFDKLYKELAESTAGIFETVIQFRDGKHPLQKDEESLSADEREELNDLVAVNNEKLRANIAALVAMDNFRKNGKFEAAADPDQLEKATNKILSSQGIETAMTILLAKAGQRPENLTDFFWRINRPELSELLAGVEKPQLSRQTQENAEKEQGPDAKKQEKAEKEKGPDEKKPENRELTEADSPVRRFQAGLKKLQEDVKASESGQARLNIAESRKGVLKLLALREMGADQNIGPNTPVSDQEVRDRMHAILQKKGDGHSLYRAVYERLKSEYKIGKVVEAIQGGESTKEFRSKLMNAAELKPKEEKKETSIGSNPVKQ